MKFLICTIVHNPTDARIFRREIEAILNAGHEVTAIAPWEDSTPGPEAVVRVRVPRAKGRSRFESWRSARSRLRDLIAEHDLVILHDPEILLFFPWLEARRYQTKIVWDVHEDLAAAIGMKSYIPKPLRGVLAKLVRLGERVVEKHAVLLLAERGYQDRFKVKHELVLNLPPVAPLPAIAGRKRQAIYVGSITYERGLKEMLQLAKALQNYEIHLRLIGECPNQDAAAEIKAATNVSWEGSLPNQQAMQAVAESLVGLSLLQDLPNYRHSMPTKILEYMASGVLVVTTPLPLAVEIAKTHGMVLSQFRDLDFAEIAAEINQQIASPNFTAQIQAAYDLVAADYNWNNAGPKFVQYLESIVKK